MAEQQRQILRKMPVCSLQTIKFRTDSADALGTANASVLYEWDEFLSSTIQASHLQIDFVELWMMYDDPADVVLDVQDWIEGMTCQSGHGWESLCSQAHLDDPEVSRYGLRGFPWNTNLCGPSWFIAVAGGAGFTVGALFACTWIWKGARKGLVTANESVSGQ